VTNPYPREYLALHARRGHARVAPRSRPAGAFDPDPRVPFDPAGESIRYHEDLWPRFVAAAIFLFLLDLLVRRVRLFDRKRTARPGVKRASIPPGAQNA